MTTVPSSDVTVRSSSTCLSTLLGHNTWFWCPLEYYTTSDVCRRERCLKPPVAKPGLNSYHIVNHMIKFYCGSFFLACENQKVPIGKEMSSTQFQAMLSTVKVSGTGERELKKHLSAHLGKGFCPTRQSIDMLAKGHCDIHYWSLEFTYNGKEKSEFIEWTEKNIHNEIIVYLQQHLTSK
jgi:hypothetical protein